MTAAAESAREHHRDPSGRFGTQPSTESPTSLTDPWALPEPEPAPPPPGIDQETAEWMAGVEQRLEAVPPREFEDGWGHDGGVVWYSETDYDPSDPTGLTAMQVQVKVCDTTAATAPFIAAARADLPRALDLIRSLAAENERLRGQTSPDGQVTDHGTPHPTGGYTRVRRLDGYTSYLDAGSCLHREDGPAHVGVDGHQEWWRHGQLHNADGPAVVYPDGSCEWWVDGEFRAQKDRDDTADL